LPGADSRDLFPSLAACGGKQKEKKRFFGGLPAPQAGFPPSPRQRARPSALPLALSMLVPGITGVEFSVTVVVMVVMMTVVTVFVNG